MPARSRDHLRVALEELAEARRNLEFSAARVAGLNEDSGRWTDDEAERAEAFLARFARGVDLLTNKVWRALFRVELEPEGTVLDRIRLAEKRGLIGDGERMRVLKELRNRIAHDYAGGSVGQFVSFARSELPFLDSGAESTRAYAVRYL